MLVPHHSPTFLITLVSAVTSILSVELEEMARTHSSSPSTVALKDATNGEAVYIFHHFNDPPSLDIKLA